MTPTTAPLIGAYLDSKLYNVTVTLALSPAVDRRQPLLITLSEGYTAGPIDWITSAPSAPTTTTRYRKARTVSVGQVVG
jgi:hypothetical protein